MFKKAPFKLLLCKRNFSVKDYLNDYPIQHLKSLPPDHVISKHDTGKRFEKMPAPDEHELVDLWMKASDLLAASKFNPHEQNRYNLFTRSNPSVAQPIPMGDVSVLKASNFDPERKTVFIVHGWKNDPTNKFNVDLVKAYPIAEDVNLFMVDWSVGAAESYITAVFNDVRSGEHVAEYIKWLNSASGATLDKYHIIGHSLGGHQVGVIGRSLGGKVPYITSLDPALPGWITNPSAFKITDAIYTEVIHTNGGFCGKIRPIGHVDFYPNGGSVMPGCHENTCHHHRCIDYLTESLINGGFTGYKCESMEKAEAGDCSSKDTLKMGGLTPKTGSTGIYILKTNAKAPFSKG